MKSLRVVIITGLSGSGKSTALKALEDIGFFCVDNLPILLLEKFLQMQSSGSNEISKIALVMDLREKNFPDKHIDVISKLKSRKYHIEILFLDATDEALMHRFSETRRVHPLSDRGSVLDSIRQERKRLAALKEISDNVIDTSLYSVHQLKQLLQRHYLAPLEEKKLLINLISFGYRFGLPPEADIVFDVRFLPNPYFVKDLKKHDGNNKKVERYVLRWDDTKEFLRQLVGLLGFLLPLYEKEGKSYLTIAAGCTGGRHRSVVILNELIRYFKDWRYSVTVTHRDISRI
ncbi:MAG: RNase adapter RapZ [Deltaproteobacteria bacterium]|nr:RNase adapter RapZ [Deltaproteobacteria bacterium]